MSLKELNLTPEQMRFVEKVSGYAWNYAKFAKDITLAGLTLTDAYDRIVTDITLMEKAEAHTVAYRAAMEASRKAAKEEITVQKERQKVSTSLVQLVIKGKLSLGTIQSAHGPVVRAMVEEKLAQLAS